MNRRMVQCQPICPLWMHTHTTKTKIYRCMVSIKNQKSHLKVYTGWLRLGTHS